MYDEPMTGRRSFLTATIGGALQPFGEVTAGPVWLFFADLSEIVGDNGGDTIVTLTLDRAIAVHSATWTKFKRLYEPGPVE
jgi:hypothetical protein